MERAARGAAGDVPVRTYRPEHGDGPLPLVVNFHGGWWTLGNLDSADWLCSNVAAAVGAVVVSVDYRLAPEHRFPAGLDDCYAGLTWLAGHAAELGVAPDRIGLWGDSAGAGLAAGLAILARDLSGPAIRSSTRIQSTVCVSAMLCPNRKIASHSSMST